MSNGLRPYDIQIQDMIHFYAAHFSASTLVVSYPIILDTGNLIVSSYPPYDMQSRRSHSCMCRRLFRLYERAARRTVPALSIIRTALRGPAGTVHVTWAGRVSPGRSRGGQRRPHSDLPSAGDSWTGERGLRLCLDCDSAQIQSIAEQRALHSTSTHAFCHLSPGCALIGIDNVYMIQVNPISQGGFSRSCHLDTI